MKNPTFIGKQKSRPAVFAVAVAQAAVAEATGSIDEALVIMRRLRVQAAEAGDARQADLAARAESVLRFVARPYSVSMRPTATVLEALAKARRAQEEAQQRQA